jgi:hypothetical protein
MPDAEAAALGRQLGAGAPFDLAVIPFHQPRLGLRARGKSSLRGGFTGALQRAGVNRVERLSRQRLQQPPRALTPGCGQRHVGAPGMAPEARPVGLAMPHQPDLEIRV